MQKKPIYYVIFLIFFFITDLAIAIEVPIVPFPLDNYDQNIDHWIDPKSPGYDKQLLSVSDQKNRLEEFYNHYCSPWSSEYVKNNSKTYSEKELINTYGNPPTKNQEEIGYGANLNPYNDQWIKTIINNMKLSQFELPFQYNPNNRGIAIKNLLGRILPTNDPYFYGFSLAGQGYPFDNLQDSVVWVGTPVYILGQTQDQQWYLVLSPHSTEWVQSDGIAKVNYNFVEQWQECAKQKMVAIIRTNISIIDVEGQYQFNAYVGTVFPAAENSNDTATIKALIPVADTHHNAQITFAELSKESATIMPFEFTPHNFATVISTLLGRPYGWGNMYFYNDCSAELKSLYTPFGIWLPRNSGSQEKAGKIVIDNSSKNTQERLYHLIKQARKMTTIIYINGHVMSYIGNYPNPNSDSHESIAMTYQNIWGLRPPDGSYRAVIGKSVLFPILPAYPENLNLTSLASRKIFKLIQLASDPEAPDDGLETHQQYKYDEL